MIVSIGEVESAQGIEGQIVGRKIWAATAGPPSPLKPLAPVPAITAAKRPWRSIRKTR